MHATRYSLPVSLLLSLATHAASEEAAKPTAPMFREAGKDIIPFEDTSRRKWDAPIIADLDQNGHIDLLLTEHGKQANIFWNEGGKFSAPQKVVGGDTHGVSAGDFDQDGLMDLLIYPGGGGGKKPSNPVRYHIKGRTITGGDEYAHFERCRGRAAKLVDVDNNGSLDLVLSAFPLPTQRENGANLLFRSAGKGDFEFASRLPQTQFMSFRLLVTDTNNDGISDLLYYGGESMVLNRGGEGMTFSNASSDALGALANTSFVSAVAEIDFDNDGDLDLFLTRSDHAFQEETHHDCECSNFAYYVFASFTEDIPFRYDLEIEGDFRMENLQTAYPDHDVFIGAEKKPYEFTVDQHGGKDFVLTPEEAKGWPEDTSQNGLNIGYLGGNIWRLGGETKSATSGLVHNVKTVKSGAPDTPVKDLPARLFENRDGKFVDVTEQLGISVPDQTSGVVAGDFDNDGWTDLFILRKGNPASPMDQILLMNQGGKSFTPAENHGINAHDPGATGCGAEMIDYDEDGDLDIIFCNERGRWHLYTNQTPRDSSRNFLVVNVGPSPTGKATALGAVLTLKAGGRTYKRIVGSTSAAFSQGLDTRLHIGLGSVDKIDSARVRWTNGETIDVAIEGVNRVVRAGGPGI